MRPYKGKSLKKSSSEKRNEIAVSKRASMKLSGKKPWYMEWLLIILGTGLMAVAINSMYDAADLVTGGFSGLAIIIKQLSLHFTEGGIPLWISNAVLNVPLFLAGFFLGGLSLIGRSLLGSVFLSIWLAVLPVWDIAGGDLLLAAVYGGVFQGVGIGLVFLGHGNTGGTDMLAVLIQKFMRHLSVSQVMQVVDGLIVLVGIYMFGVQKALYAMISVFLVTRVSDGLIEGLKFSKAACIITDRHQELSEVIMRKLGRGVTAIDARGMYSGHPKTMLYCAVNKKEMVSLKEIVDETDPEAFVIVTDAREVHGKGFLERL